MDSIREWRPDWEMRKKLRNCFFMAQLLGLGSVGLVVFWCVHYLGGYALDSSDQQFNLHPTFMIIGPVYLYGNAIVLYRVMNSVKRSTVKALHALCHGLSFLCVVVAMYAVVDQVISNNLPQFQSLHSWMGIATLTLLSLQLLFGATIFLCPRVSPETRESFAPLHRLMGILMFVMIIITVCSGICERVIYTSVTSSISSPRITNQSIVANCLGVAVFLYSIGIVFITVNSKFERMNYSDYDSLEE